MFHPSISSISSMQRFRFSPVKPPDTSTELEFRSIFWSLDSWHLTKSEVSHGDVPPFKKIGENLKIFELKPYHFYAFFCVFFVGGIWYLVFSISCRLPSWMYQKKWYTNELAAGFFHLAHVRHHKSRGFWQELWEATMEATKKILRVRTSQRCLFKTSWIMIWNKS